MSRREAPAGGSPSFSQVEQGDARGCLRPGPAARSLRGVEQRGRRRLPGDLQVARPRAEDALAVGQHADLEGPERRQRRPGVAHALERKAGVSPRVLQQNLHASGMLVQHGGDVVDAVEHDDPAVIGGVVERHHVQRDHAVALRHPPCVLHAAN